MSTVYLIPAPLFENEAHAIPENVKQQAVNLQYYFAENIRTTRRVLKLYDKTVNIDNIHFEEMNHRNAVHTAQFKEWIQAGYDIGIMSEAGLPAIADPGSVLVAIAHQLGAKVLPYTGPSSIALSLIASGMNGQHFEFLGYLPVDNAERSKKIKEIELKASQQNTQIFIETPYRNTTLLEHLLKQLHPDIGLCIGYNLTAADEQIISKTVKQWKANPTLPDFHKKPCIFLVGKLAGV